tara:strand:- start:2675 stop:3283 length:609 start_codon:yes stop_codon:yes gene_type:complete
LEEELCKDWGGQIKNKKLMKFLIIILISIFINFYTYFPVSASRSSDSYDGNIFPIYAGNGSIVPPQTTLRESIKNKRIAILFFYLDDNANSKSLAPSISGLDLIWRNTIDIIALTTDELQNRLQEDPKEESFYWNGFIPQTVILDGEGNVKYNKNGKIDIDEINKIISDIKGIDYDKSSFSIESFNEYNSRISKNPSKIKAQ